MTCLEGSIKEVEGRREFSVLEMTGERRTGGSRWREKGRGWRPVHRRRSLNEGIKEACRSRKFSVLKMSGETRTGGSRWREKGRGWRPGHRRRSLDDRMGLRPILLL